MKYGLSNHIRAILIVTILPASWLLAEGKLYYGPHITSTAPWTTKIFVFNSGPSDEDVTLTFWDVNGVQTNQTHHTVPAMDAAVFVMTREIPYQLRDGEMLLDPFDGTCTLQTQSGFVTALLSFQFGESQSITQFFLSDTLGYQYMLPNRGEPPFSWTGLALMNAKNDLIEVNLEAFDQGILVGRTDLEIAANSKYVAVSDAIWADLNLLDFDRILVSSDQAFPAPVLITGNTDQDRHVFFTGVVTQTTPPEFSQFGMD